MNETLVTVAGNVAGEPRTRVTSSGVRVTSFRLASTERRYHKELQSWRDGDTVYYTVTCWRTVAENVAESVAKGQPLVVHGRLRVSSYEKDGVSRTSVEIEARSLGHDLTWGVSTFTKAAVGGGAERQLVEEIEADLDDDVDPESFRRPRADVTPMTEDAA